MRTIFSERVKRSHSAELRLGIASWDEGDESEKSVKYAWKNKNGHVARGGEIPVEVLPQALKFAIECHYLSLSQVAKVLQKTRPAKPHRKP